MPSGTPTQPTAVAAIGGEVDGLLSKAVQAVTLTVRFVPQVQVSLYNDLPAHQTADGEVTIELGDLYGSEARKLLLKGEDSVVFIGDNGSGMKPIDANEALRFGTRRSYAGGDLGRYGLGLKTASLSQARSLTLVTRGADRKRPIRRTLDAFGHIKCQASR